MILKSMLNGFAIGSCLGLVFAVLADYPDFDRYATYFAFLLSIGFLYVGRERK